LAEFDMRYSTKAANDGVRAGPYPKLPPHLSADGIARSLTTVRHHCGSASAGSA